MWKIPVINRHGQRKQCIKGLLQTYIEALMYCKRSGTNFLAVYIYSLNTSLTNSYVEIKSYFASRSLFCAERLYSVPCKLIAAVVVFVVAVTFNLNKSDFVRACQIYKRLPKILIFNRFSCGGFPAVGYPAVKPCFIEGTAKIRAVCIQVNLAGLL